MNKKLGLIIAVLAILLINSNASFAQKKSNNDSTPTVSLQSMDGSTLAAGNLKGKVTVLAIGATWLPLSRQQAAIVNQLQQTYGNREVAIYFVSTDVGDVKSKNYADNAKIKTFAENNKISVAVLRDVNGTSARFYNLDQIPAFVILNKDGEIAGTVTGLGTDEESVKSAIAQISEKIDKVL